MFLPGESPWTEEPGGLPSMGLQKSRIQPKQLSMHAWSSLLYGLSLVAASGGYPLAVVHELLIAVASLIVEQGL